MDLHLKDKVALVMASSSGLGLAIALEYAREGAKVMICSPHQEKLERASRTIAGKTGNTPAFQVCDMTRPEDICRLVRKTEETFGTVHILVNNAGGPPPGPFDNFGDETWQFAFELNLLSYVRTIREVLPLMRKQHWGRIINSTSSSVKQVIDSLILSNTFRLGVIGLTKTLSRELAGDGILVNAIGPGRFDTDRIRQLDRDKSERTGLSMDEVQAGSLMNIPMGRYGKPEEYARLALFLGSEANTYITGQTILADGGMVRAL
jgi:3-oxoacyl-[acyl-carrier protein] reductase